MYKYIPVVNKYSKSVCGQKYIQFIVLAVSCYQYKTITFQIQLNSSASVNQLPILGQTQVFTQKINMGQIQQPIRYRLIHNPLDGIVVDQSWISLDPRGGF